jgi:hypothetical protein
LILLLVNMGIKKHEDAEYENKLKAKNQTAMVRYEIMMITTTIMMMTAMTVMIFKVRMLMIGSLL